MQVINSISPEQFNALFVWGYFIAFSFVVAMLTLLVSKKPVNIDIDVYSIDPKIAPATLHNLRRSQERLVNSNKSMHDRMNDFLVNK